MYLKAISIALLLVIVQHSCKMLYQLGIHKTVYNHTPGPCRHVDNIVNGSEDMFLLPNNKVLVSSGAVYFALPLPANHRGSIYIVDLGNTDSKARELDIVGFPGPIFHPHGLSAWVDDTTGQVLVFIVLHNPESIAKFELDEAGNMLTMLTRYSSKLMVNINSVLPTSANSFYFTNMASTNSPIWARIELALALPFATVVYYDGAGYSHAIKGMLIANGLAASKDLSTVYLGALDQVLVFSRSSNNELVVKKVIPLDFAADNLFVDSSGSIWVAGVPRLYDLVSYLGNPSLKAGSRVLKIQLSSNHYNITDVYVDDGDVLIASSKAIYHSGHLLIGTISHRLLHCEVKAF